MIHCPSCGHENAEGALLCAQCGRALRLTSMDGGGQPPEPLEAGELTPPEPTPPPPFTPPVQLPGVIPPRPLYEMRPMSPPLPFRQPPLSGKQKTARYFIGIGLGFLPVLVAVAFVSIAGGVGGDIASTL